MPNEHQYSSNLKSARAGSIRSSVENTKKNVKAATNVMSLMTYVDPFMDWLFAIAMILAIIKDVLDLVNTALIAVFGSGLALIAVTTVIVSIAIGFIMLLVGASGKQKIARTIAKRIMLLIGASIAEVIPGVGVLPIETAVVIVIFWMTLTERKVNAEKEKASSQRQPEMATA